MTTKMFLLPVVILMSLSSIAQVRDNPDEAYYEKSLIGVNIGATDIIGHLEKHPLSTGYSFDYAQVKTPHIWIGCEASFGKLVSNTPSNTWTSGLQSVNSFTAFNINARYNFNNIFKSHENKNAETISRIYWGFGLGVIDNNLGTLTEKFRPGDAKFIRGLQTKSVTGVILENVGLDYKLPHNRFVFNTILNINLQANYAFSDNVDGFPYAGNGNTFNDIYFLMTIGLHFYFGERGTKQ